MASAADVRADRATRFLPKPGRLAAIMHEGLAGVAQATSGGFSDGRLKHLALESSDYLVVYDPLTRGSQAPLDIAEYVARDHILVSYSGLTGIRDDVLAERRTVRAATTHFSALPFLLRGTDAIATIPAHAAQALCDLGPFAVSACPLAFPLYAYGISWRFDAIRNAPVMQVREMVTDAF